MTTNTTTARVYIASLSDYNAGSLLGEWFDLSAFSRDLFIGDYWMSSKGHVFRNN